jgi:hypothetical protein
MGAVTTADTNGLIHPHSTLAQRPSEKRLITTALIATVNGGAIGRRGVKGQ